MHPNLLKSLFFWYLFTKSTKTLTYINALIPSRLNWGLQIDRPTHYYLFLLWKCSTASVLLCTRYFWTSRFGRCFTPYTVISHVLCYIFCNVWLSPTSPLIFCTHKFSIPSSHNFFPHLFVWSTIWWCYPHFDSLRKVVSLNTTSLLFISFIVIKYKIKKMGNSSARLLLIGLDNAGKSTILARIIDPDNSGRGITPTIGYKKD